jgi:hypothetical protein
MPAFTAVATFLVEAAITYGVTMTAATAAFAINVVATGLAMVTSRMINGSQKGNSGYNQGVRITIPPATNNKIPVVYGSVFQQGIITDARISNDNKTMTYVLVLSEKTQTGTYTIGDIYWNDTKLQFSGSTVTGRLVPDDAGVLQTDTKFNGLIRIWVYAGGTGSGNQIFPTSSPVSALTTLGEADTDYLLDNLVFALVQVDYNADAGLTNLAQIVFEINNSLKQPGSVWQDYMTSTRYGGSFDISELNTATVAVLNTLSADQTGLIQYASDGTTPLNQARYEINGILSTTETIKNNLERINMASASWTTYDYGEGKWKVIANTTGTSTFSFTDDNIISELTLSVTPLEDQYNVLEVEFPDRGQLDQFNYFREDLNPAELNDLEPRNELRLRLDLVNNSIHAGRLGRIEMRQSRVDYVVSFTADYSAIQCQVGDVVKLTNSVYGFNEDLFRITRVREVETPEGGLVAEIVLLEYSADVYSEESLTDFVDKPISDIPVFGSTIALIAPQAPIVSTSSAHLSIPKVIFQTTIPSNSQPVTGVEIFYSTSTTGTYNLLATSLPNQSVFSQGQVVTSEVSNLTMGNWYFKARTQGRSQYSNLSTNTTSLLWQPITLGSSFIFANTGTNSITVTQEKFTPDNYNRNTEVITVSFVSPVTGEAVVNYSGVANYTEADTLNVGEGYYSIQHYEKTFDGWNRLSFGVANSSTLITPIVSSRKFTVQRGSTATFGVYASKLQAGDTFTIDRSEINVTVTEKDVGVVSNGNDPDNPYIYF